MKLFFDEVEKEKRTKELYNKNRSWVGKLVDATKERIFNLASSLYGISAPYDLAALDADVNSEPVPDVLPRQPAVNVAVPPPVAIAGGLSAPQAPPPPPASQFQQQPQAVPPLAIAPPSQGRGGASTPNTPPSEPSSMPPPAPSPVAAPEATSSPPVDTTAPDVSISVIQCAESLSSGGCLVATTTLTIVWRSSASDLDHFAVECLKSSNACNGFTYDPHATSTVFGAEDGATYTFRAAAVDAAGNASASASQEVEVSVRPVVINEVAWAGTSPSNTADEWIELSNRSGQPVFLDGWILRSVTDDKPYLALSGAIPANGYYLIERTDDATVADVNADFTAAFGSGSGMGLGDGGEALVLEYASTTMDETPAVGACAPRWCAGSTFDRSTMERVDPDLAGSDPVSWGNNDSIIRNGAAADGTALRGTPKARNSRNYYISAAGPLEASKTLVKAKSPYFVPANGLTINAGVTLAVEPGVVVKFEPGISFPGMTARGRIEARGTAAEPIVFTSFLDDAYGGDTNGDATTTDPRAGEWQTILITDTGEPQVFEETMFRYGGKAAGGFGPSPEGANSILSIIGGNFTLRHATFEHSGTNGFTSLRSSGDVSDSVFRENIGVHASGPYGLIVGGGSVAVSGNSFEHNRNGLAVHDGPHEVSGNAFTGNIEQAVAFSSSDPSGTPTFSGNTATGNGMNGIAVMTISNDYAFIKDLVYVLGAFPVPAGKTLTIEPGVVLKMRRGFTPFVEGTLLVLGTVGESVVITSLFDDSSGGDTNGDGLCDPGNASSTAACPAPGDWYSIIIGPTSSSSTLEHVVVRYGAACAICGGAIKVDGTSVAIANAVFEKNKAFGLWLANSASTTIKSSEFRGHQPTPGAASSIGLILENSSVILDGVMFSDNDIGIGASGASAVAVGSGGVMFSANTTDDLPADLIP